MQNKDELRKFAKNLRKTLNINEISEKILQIFLSSDYYKSAQNIAAYYPYGTELNITKLFNDNSKNFYLPKMNEDDQITFHQYQKGDFLAKNSYGIFEPTGKEINVNIIDTIIIPALLVDKRGFRLGYGKGCYDKFFNKYALKVKKIVFIPDELMVNSLPTDKYDIPADVIVTQTKLSSL